MPRTCEEYAVLISARLDGALTAPEQESLEAHLALCPDCAALARSLAALSDDFAAVRSQTAGELPPADLTSRIRDAVRAEKVVPFPAKRPSPRKRWAAAAAAVAVIVCAGAFAPGGPLLKAGDTAAPGMQETAEEPLAPGMSLAVNTNDIDVFNDCSNLAPSESEREKTSSESALPAAPELSQYSTSRTPDLVDPAACRALLAAALPGADALTLTDEGLAPDGCARLFLLTGQAEDEAALFADGAVLLRSDDPAAFDAAVGR